MSEDAFWAHGLQKDLGYQVTNTKKPKKFSGFSLSCYEMWLDPCTEGFMTPDFFTPLVLRVGGQVGCLKQQNSSRNSIF